MKKNKHVVLFFVSEDLSNSAHTLNPVPGLSIGANSLVALDWRSIADVAPSIVRWLTV